MGFESVWKNARIATARPSDSDCIDIIPDGTVGVVGGKIVWVGPTNDLPEKMLKATTRVHDCRGSLMTPGLVDCHTHLVFGGNRSKEFESRLRGKTYEQIATSGGGITSTMDATRSTSDEELEHKTWQRVLSLVAKGVTTIEIKSGYGMNLEHELRLLEVINRVAERVPVSIVKTLLGLHALPQDYSKKREQYVKEICEELLPIAVSKGLVDMVDAFCESIAFSRKECSQLFKKAQALGVPVKLHADQLSDGGGATLAAEFSALSADHLEYTSEEGVRAMAQSGTVAVLLPGSFYYLNEERVPPVQKFRRFGVPMALATDANPGSSPVFSMQSAMNMGCLLFGLTPQEAFIGATRNAAMALGMEEQVGTLEIGKYADMVLWDLDDPGELAYWVGVDSCEQVIVRGNRIDLTVPSR